MPLVYYMPHSAFCGSHSNGLVVLLEVLIVEGIGELQLKERAEIGHDHHRDTLPSAVTLAWLRFRGVLSLVWQPSGLSYDFIWFQRNSMYWQSNIVEVMVTDLCTWPGWAEHSASRLEEFETENFSPIAPPQTRPKPNCFLSVNLMTSPCMNEEFPFVFNQKGELIAFSECTPPFRASSLIPLV